MNKPDIAAPGPSLLSEEDMELVDALQVNPRATWAQLSSVLDVDAVTVARRWRRLNEGGQAWVTAALGPRQEHTMSMAFLELDCESGAAIEVAESLGREKHLITVQHVAGHFDLFLIAVAPSIQTLSDYLLGVLPTLAGVRNVRSHIATRVFDASRRWRLRVLPPPDVARIAETVEPTQSTRPMDSLDRSLFLALSVDGRTSYPELAARVGRTERTAQRRVTRMVATGDVTFRCDLVRPAAGWHASAVLWLEVPDHLIEETGQALLAWPQTRTCAAVAGASNLLLTVGLRAVSELHSLVTRLSESFPNVRVVDRHMVLRQTKLYGRLLDASGRAVGVVPVDPWSLLDHGV